jgi:spermidine synthase
MTDHARPSAPAVDRTGRRRPVAALLVLFVLSGAAGLVYEVVWARQLVLVFGNTSQAVSTILTGFFGGLAIGGAVGGRLADRVARPLRMYGLLELAIVVVVILTPVSFHLIGEAYRGIYPSLANVPVLLALVRFTLAILALAPATLLMGATLPTLTRFLTGGPAGLAGAFQGLYTANTVGAIGGTAVAGFVLIELLGLTGALLVGAACSLTAGTIALLLDRWVGSGQAPATREPVRQDGPLEQVAPPSQRTIALLLAFVSGLTSLGYQVVWNRLMSAGTGSSTYVFAVILTTFLAGIAMGALLLGFIRRRVRNTIGLIAFAQVLTAVLVALGSIVLATPALPLYGGSPEFSHQLRIFAQTAILVVLPATLVMGITFPATAALLGDSSGREGGAAGSLIAVNTVGALVATFVLPFVVIPLIGSPATLALLAIVNAAVGAGLFLSLRGSGGLVRLAGGASGLVAVAVVVAVAVTGAGFLNPTIRLVESVHGTVFASTEDEIASVVAGEANGYRQLWVGGSSMTLITVDTKLMPILPLMLRPDATHGLVIAFGMGTAFRSALVAGVTADVVELVPSVPSEFKWFYPDADAVLADPRGHVIIADGRNHVELTTSTYDFVVVDPPPPIETSGVSVISTLEFYQAAKSRLNANGVMVQWVPFGQTLAEFLAHVRTFATVFPNVRVIAGAGGFGLYMIGSDGSVDLDPTSMVAALARPGVLDDIDSAPDGRGRTIAQWVDTLQANTWSSGDALRKAVGDGPLVTDDRPMPEYFLLRRLLDRHAPALTMDALHALTH